jgi:hypothetical protein
VEAIHNPTEAESKDLLQPECMKAIENLQSYQNEMRAWRDKKSKVKAEDLVLLRSPRTEASKKLELKWTEKIRPGSFRLADTKGRELEHSWNADNLYRFYVNCGAL